MKMDFNGLNLHNTELSLTCGLPYQLLKEGIPQIALAGRSNVGKSSLINSLLARRKLARVSSEPGKTITVNYYTVDGKINLVDLPGYGFAKRPKGDITKWSSLTERYFESNGALKYVLQLVDIRIGLTGDDRAMLDYLDYYGVPYIIVCTKCDKLSKTKLNEQTKKLLSSGTVRAGTQIILYSSVTNEGRDTLWQMICSAASGEYNASE